MSKLRVMVVDDSLSVRRRLCEVIAQTTDCEVVAEASDGQQAIELCAKQRPNVITMDMVLPGVSGLAATEHIMAHFPTPILVVSSSFNRGEIFKTYDALSAGAVDVIEKPTGREPEGQWETQFLAALRVVSKVRVITHPRARLQRAPHAIRAELAEAEGSGLGPRSNRERAQALALGASTGGPGALVAVIGGLGREFSLPVLTVLHIGAPFAKAFGDWLSAQVERDVLLAAGGESLESLQGRVVLAPPNHHLVLEGNRLELTSSPERHSCRPSVDVLFESVAQALGARALGCLLTGMGRDGAEGLLRMRHAGAHTIAQDEETCVVYGMPRAAALLGSAEQILPLHAIGPALANVERKRRGAW